MDFRDVPEDILLQIVSYLSVQDVLALKQTCRVLHAFGSTDYLWHRLIEKSDLILDIPVNVPTGGLSADDLQLRAIKAIRLQRNWRSASSRIKRTTSLGTVSDALFEHIQFVAGGRWLLTAQGSRRFENRNHTKISLWSLANIQDPHCVAQFELVGKHRNSSVTVQLAEKWVTFVVALFDGSRDFIEIRIVQLDFEFNVLDPMSPSPVTITSRRLEIPPLPEDDPTITLMSLIEGISVCENILVATVARIIPGREISSRILIADTRMGSARWMCASSLQPLLLPQARLHDRHIVVLGHVRKDFTVRVYEMPRLPSSGIHSNGDPQGSPEEVHTVEWGPIIKQYQYTLGGSPMDPIHIPHVFTTSLAIMIFNDELGRIIHFPFDKPSKPPRDIEVPLPADISIRLVGIGASGRRAVWMEHSLETTRSRIMKLEVEKTESGGLELYHGELLPPDSPLPFSTDACHMFAFDEATCRLCLGLWDGSLYIVDFM